MRVELREVQFSRDQKEHGAHHFKSRVTTGFSLCCLEQTIKRFDESIGLTSSRPRHNAVEVAANEHCHLFHPLDFRAHHVRTPLPQRKRRLRAILRTVSLAHDDR
jgi:hypothetical protein